MSSRTSGATGAMPSPQLPMTSVVTPYTGSGIERRVPEHLDVVVGVAVDQTRGHDGAAGVDLALAVGREVGGDLDDHTVAHTDVGGVGPALRCRRRRCHPERSDPTCRLVYQGFTLSPAKAMERESAGISSRGTATSATVGPTRSATGASASRSKP